MSDRPKGKYVRVDAENPEAVGLCDYSGLLFNRSDLLKQMEWRGNSLQWTGFYVGRPYVDVPNEQNRPPILPPDPVPIKDPRPFQAQSITWSNNPLGLWPSIEFTWASLCSSDDGALAPIYAQSVQNLQNYNWGTW